MLTLRISLYPIGLTNFSHKINYIRRHGLNLHYRHLTV